MITFVLSEDLEVQNLVFEEFEAISLADLQGSAWNLELKDIIFHSP